MSRGIGGHHAPNRGATDTWLTPPAILKALGAFDLDPCAAPDPRPWPTAARHITWPDDGLFAEWSGRVWLNPPYGSVTGAWLKRLAAHGCGTALTFARTETAAWQRHVWPHATAILFLSGRIHFHYPDGERAKANAGGPNALIAYGEADARILDRCALAGCVVRPNGRPVPSSVSSAIEEEANAARRRHEGRTT